MQALGRPHAYVNCADCRSSRLMFESVLDQLSGHQRERCKGYAPGAQCEKLEDFDRMVPVACPKDGMPPALPPCGTGGAAEEQPLPAQGGRHTWSWTGQSGCAVLLHACRHHQ